MITDQNRAELQRISRGMNSWMQRRFFGRPAPVAPVRVVCPKCGGQAEQKRGRVWAHRKPDGSGVCNGIVK